MKTTRKLQSTSKKITSDFFGRKLWSYVLPKIDHLGRLKLN